MNPAGEDRRRSPGRRLEDRERDGIHERLALIEERLTLVQRRQEWAFRTIFATFIALAGELVVILSTH